MKNAATTLCFSTADRGSFAEKTFLERIPAIIDRAIEANGFAGQEKDSLLALKDEVLRGRVTDPWSYRDGAGPDSVLRSDGAAPRAAPGGRTEGMEKSEVLLWRRALRPHSGRTWLDLPFYFAEALLYLRILLATGYFDPSAPLYMRDPFEVFKRKELFEGGGVERGRSVMSTIRGLGTLEEKLLALVTCSLWGNRVDLSLFHVAESARGRDPFEKTDRLLIDHRRRLVELFVDAGRVDFILDNGGQELVCDLLLALNLIRAGKSVRFHAKKHPFYVSDAQGKDVEAAITALKGDRDPALSAAGYALSSSAAGGKLVVGDHFFWNGPSHFPDLPRALTRELRRSDLIVLKGDVNYRRLLSDRKWESGTSMEEAASYFPAPFAVLRTMKSDAVVDLRAERVAALDGEDPQWKVNGERGMIRVVERRVSWN
jgi:hypothetical protein